MKNSKSDRIKAAAHRALEEAHNRKKELEETMRTHGIELDRRKSKSVLLKEVETFFGAK